MAIRLCSRLDRLELRHGRLVLFRLGDCGFRREGVLLAEVSKTLARMRLRKGRVAKIVKVGMKEKNGSAKYLVVAQYDSTHH